VVMIASIDSSELSRDAADELAYLGRYRAECHITAARFYSNVHTFVGMAAAGLAAVAGGTAFAGQTLIAGIAAVGSAILAGFLTIQKPDERTQEHWKAAGQYNELSDDIDLYFRFGWRDGDAAVQGEVKTRIAPSQAETQAPSQATAEENSRDDIAALARFRKRCGAVEATSFPVPRHLCASAENYISANDEWYPPLKTGRFAEWRERRAQPHSRWRFPRLLWSRQREARRARSDHHDRAD
jgi:hypothetical protein